MTSRPPLSRRAFVATTAAAAVGASAARHVPPLHAESFQGRRPVPSASQLEWQRDELALIDPVVVGLIDLREDVSRGQLVVNYSVEGMIEGDWRPLTRGTTIGLRKLDRFPHTGVTRVRLRIDEALAEPGPVKTGLYAGA